jgi:xylose isomerase
MHGMLGSIDANRGDLLLGWDTDQFPTDLYLTTQCMLVILGQGGLAPGGVNFDAKVRRESFEPVDLFHAHIGGMDAFAWGLKIAAKMRPMACYATSSSGASVVDTGVGQQIESGKATFDELEKYMLEKGEASVNVSGRQELLENVFNRYLRQ